MPLAILVEGLSKQYQLGIIGTQTIREDLSRWWWRMRGQPYLMPNIGPVKNDGNLIWALRDVNFQVERGEAIGIIGANGAGKSTLLKILSRVTTPTSGVARIKGRLASLLEVGTGFHPELTGRENVYLNGTILGMKKADIARKFDEIVSFSEIEKFIDTPVKHYSSGMYVRLAFAVSTHVDADILLVDEALAVGDASFQKKCLNKMRELSTAGRTVLFVSHNLAAIEHLCQKACFLKEGKIHTYGDTRSVTDAYYKSSFASEDSTSEVRLVPERGVKFLQFEVQTTPAIGAFCVRSGAACDLAFLVRVKRIVPQAYFGIALWGSDGTLIWAMQSDHYVGDTFVLKEGLYEAKFIIPSLPLRAGSYQVHVSASDLAEGALDVWLQPRLQVIASKQPKLPSQWQGILDVDGQFQLVKREDETL